MCLLPGLLLCGCPRQAKDSPQHKVQPLQLSQLSFENAARGKLLRRLDACLRDHAKKWRHLPYRRGGNFIRASWCTGKGARDDCQIAAGSVNRADQHVLSLYTLHHPGAPNRAFGLGVNALWTPPGPEWGARLGLHEGGKSIVGSGLSLDLRRYGAAGASRPAVKLSLGSSGSYRVHQTHVRWSSSKEPQQELALFVSSAKAFGERGVAQVSALRKRVLEAIEGGRVKGCDHGPYEGTPSPPAPSRAGTGRRRPGGRSRCPPARPSSRRGFRRG